MCDAWFETFNQKNRPNSIPGNLITISWICDWKRLTKSLINNVPGAKMERILYFTRWFRLIRFKCNYLIWPQEIPEIKTESQYFGRGLVNHRYFHRAIKIGFRNRFYDHWNASKPFMPFLSKNQVNHCARIHI